MDRDEKLYAGSVCIAIEWGLADYSEAVGWADKFIESKSDPNIEVIDLSLSSSSSETTALLKLIQEPLDEWIVLKKFFSRFNTTKSLSDELALSLAKKLFFRLSEAQYVPEAFSNFWGYWDEIDLAINGSTGDPEQIAQQFLEDMKSLAI